MPQAVVIDINLIQQASNTAFVYVQGELNGKNVAERRTVVVGRSYDGFAEILSGLKAGDKVITAGYQNLIAGQEIRL